MCSLSDHSVWPPESSASFYILIQHLSSFSYFFSPMPAFFCVIFLQNLFSTLRSSIETKFYLISWRFKKNSLKKFQLFKFCGKKYMRSIKVLSFYLCISSLIRKGQYFFFNQGHGFLNKNLKLLKYKKILLLFIYFF